jgi:DNA end-binding protein Ku
LGIVVSLRIGMATRTFWKGHLKLSLVTCSVQMMPATSDRDKVRFHTMNRATGNRVVSEFIDAGTGKPVDDEDEVKGYEQAEGKYVLLEDEELDSVALESTRTIDIDMFVPNDSLEWIWYDQPHFLMPNDEVGEEAFSVIRDAMAAAKMAGISRLVLYGRERAVLLRPRDKGIILWTLRYGDEVRDPGVYFKDIEPPKPDPKLVALVEKLIDEKSVKWSPKMVDDPVQENLLKIIATKKKPARRTARARGRKAAPPPSNVIDITEALRRSIAREKKRGR